MGKVFHWSYFYWRAFDCLLLLSFIGWSMCIYIKKLANMCFFNFFFIEHRSFVWICVHNIFLWELFQLCIVIILCIYLYLRVCVCVYEFAFIYSCSRLSIFFSLLFFICWIIWFCFFDCYSMVLWFFDFFVDLDVKENIKKKSQFTNENDYVRIILFIGLRKNILFSISF